MMALFDIHVVDTDARSYLSHSPGAMLASAEAEKKRKYCDALTKRHATFMPLCFSVDGLVGDEATCFLKHLARSLSVTWDCHHSEIIGWLWARLAFALVRATNVCIRGLGLNGDCLDWRMEQQFLLIILLNFLLVHCFVLNCFCLSFTVSYLWCFDFNLALWLCMLTAR